MIDILTEDLIDLRQACRLAVFKNAKTGRPAHIASMYRHVMRGARGAGGERVRLETVRTPSGLKTSTQAVQRFIAALTDPDADIPAPRSSQRQRELDQADAVLASAGMI